MRYDRVVAIAFTALTIQLACGTGHVRAGLLSEWRFDETSGIVAHDSVGGINGTLSSGAAFDPGAGPGSGIYSGAISLDQATDSYVTMGNVYNFTSGDFSTVTWVKTTQTTGQFAVSRHHTGSGNGYFIALNNVGDGVTTVGSHFYTSGGGVGSSINVEDGAWHQLAAVYQAGVGARYFVDGVFRASIGAIPIGSNDAPFMVGGVDSFGVPGGYYTGLIADVRVYDNALSSSDVESIYQQVLTGGQVPGPSSLSLVGLAMACVLGYGATLRNRGRSPFDLSRG